MKERIKKRIEEIEKKYTDNPLIVIARTESGKEVKMTMRELLKRDDMSLKKVIGGTCIKDLELYLAQVKEKVFEELEEGSAEQ